MRDWEREEAELARWFGAEVGSPARAELVRRVDTYARAVVAAARLHGAVAPTGEEVQASLQWLRRPVVVCGSHRSGTTLMRQLLDGHPALRVLPSEGTYLESFPHVACAAPSATAMDAFAAEWVARLVDPSFEPHFKLGRTVTDGPSPMVTFVARLFAWDTALRARRELPARFVALLALVAALPGPDAPSRWVEKTPLAERHLAPLLDAFPSAVVVHLVRDPRAVLSSLLALRRRAGLGDRDRLVLAHRLARSLALAVDGPRRYPGRYLVVRYEALTADPARTMREVAALLDVAVHPSLDTPTDHGHPVAPNSSFERGAPGVVSRAERTVDPREAELAIALAAAPARQLGYALPELGALRRWRVFGRELPRYLVSRDLRARVIPRRGP